EGLAVPTVMPTVARELGGLAAYGWVFSAFMLANVVGITAAGQHTDRGGPLGAFAAGRPRFGLRLAPGGAPPALAALTPRRRWARGGGGGVRGVARSRPWFRCGGRVPPRGGAPPGSSPPCRGGGWPGGWSGPGPRVPPPPGSAGACSSPPSPRRSRWPPRSPF